MLRSYVKPPLLAVVENQVMGSRPRAVLAQVYSVLGDRGTVEDIVVKLQVDGAAEHGLIVEHR